MLVKMRAGQDMVSARLTIQGIVFWHYIYVADDHEDNGSGSSATPNVFNLGPPAKLHLDINSWRVVLTNQTTGNVNHNVLLEWLQAGKVIATWGPKTGALKTGEDIVLDGDCVLVIDAAPAGTNP